MTGIVRGFEIVIGGGVWGPQLYSVWTTADGKGVSNIGVCTSYAEAKAVIEKNAGLPLTFDAEGKPAGAPATSYSELLITQRRYEFLRNSGWVSLPERILQDDTTFVTPGRIGGTVVDQCVDAKLKGVL